MDKSKLKKGAWAAGGIALLAAVSALCVKGMKAVDKKLKARKEAQDFVEECDVEETVVEAETEEAVVEEVSVSEEPAAEEAVEGAAEEEKPEE